MSPPFYATVCTQSYFFLNFIFSIGVIIFVIGVPMLVIGAIIYRGQQKQACAEAQQVCSSLHDRS